MRLLADLHAPEWDVPLVLPRAAPPPPVPWRSGKSGGGEEDDDDGDSATLGMLLAKQRQQRQQLAPARPQAHPPARVSGPGNGTHAAGMTPPAGPSRHASPATDRCSGASCLVPRMSLHRRPTI